MVADKVELLLLKCNSLSSLYRQFVFYQEQSALLNDIFLTKSNKKPLSQLKCHQLI